MRLKKQTSKAPWKIFNPFLFLTRPGYSVNMHRCPSYTLTGKAVTLSCHTNGFVYRPARDTVTDKSAQIDSILNLLMQFIKRPSKDKC